MVKKSSPVADKSNNDGINVKRGGTKRKIPMKWIANKQSRAVTRSKRTKGFFSKAAQLCLLSPGTQIAILVDTSSDSKVSFKSFGHSSVDAVVSAFLSGQPPPPPPSEIGDRKDQGLGFWWEEEIPDTVEHLTAAMKSMSKLITNVEALRVKKLIIEQQEKDLKINEQGTQEVVQTLDLLQSFDSKNKTNTEIVVLDDDDDDVPAAFNNNEEQDPSQVVCDSLWAKEKPADGCSKNQEMDNGFGTTLESFKSIEKSEEFTGSLGLNLDLNLSPGSQAVDGNNKSKSIL